jgi:hypothetical protein
LLQVKEKNKNFKFFKKDFLKRMKGFAMKDKKYFFSGSNLTSIACKKAVG